MNLYGKFLTNALIFLVMFSSASLTRKDYHHDGLKVTEKVKNFVADHNISGSDLEKVHKIIELMHDRFLFVNTNRKRIQSWINDLTKVEEFKSHLESVKVKLELLNRKRTTALLSKEEYGKRKELQQFLFYGYHDLKVYQEVIKKKDISPQDLPFVVSGAEAVEYGIQDGCTTATKVFIVLAKATGIEDIRFVPAGNVPDYNEACSSKGAKRKQEITINGHFFALAKINNRWALVNCTYYDPFSLDENTRYEIFYKLDGMDITPEMIKHRILKIPSFQREGKPAPPNRLYVIAVGKDSDDDLDVENYDALMNMSVSGDRNNSICKYDRF